jgi:hypothetical protein
LIGGCQFQQGSEFEDGRRIVELGKRDVDPRRVL